MIRNILALFGLLLLIYMSFSLESSTPVKKQGPDHFSAEAVIPYLENIATKTHPMGSTENQKVRDYIFKTLTDLGLEVRIEKGYVQNSWKPTHTRMAFVENIIATLKGNGDSTKKVIIAGHYDSVFEGPGAADDGYAIASMIETVKLLKNTPRKNDIELVITDGEEMGLFGAQHYAENNDLSNIGIMLNFEARGNAGPGIAFEFSENNAWLVEELSKVSERPIANSLSYEIYKRMPNGTDFMVFLDEGVQGINYAFIDGFSYYHNPVDNIENLSMESVQHTGENMYLMAKHFANYDFVTPPKGNASFFNFYGNLIHYPVHLDIYILIFGLCLLLFNWYKSSKDEEVNLKRIGINFISIFGILILVGGLNFGLAFIVKKLYPQYSTFYISHYYNHEWYFLAGIGLTIFLCWWLGSMLLKRYGSKSIGIATTILLAIFTIASYSFVRTGVYLMMYPMIALTIGLLLSEYLKTDDSNWQSWVLAFGMLSVFIGFWTNVSHNLFLGFSFGALPGAVIPMALFCFASISLLPVLWKRKEYLLPIFGICLFSYSLVNAHLRSKPTVSEPLKSNLFFVSDRTINQSYWASEDHYINEGHLGLLDDSEKGRLPRHLPYSRFMKKSNLNAENYASKFTLDSIPDSNAVKIKVVNPKRAGKSFLTLNEVENVQKILVNGQLNKEFTNGATGYFSSIMFGIGLDSMEVEVFKKDFSKPIELYINFSYQEMLKEEKLPKGIVRNDGFTFIAESVKF